jgi:predicted dehydrogenase
MFFEAHRLSIFTPRSLDVDVVLDLMIHDLDIVLSLVASPVREVRAVGLPVLSNKVDIANVRVEFENGCIANFTASRISTERVRKLRFFQPHQYLSLDFARQDLLMIDVTAAAGMDPRQLAQIVEQAQTAEMAKAAQQAQQTQVRQIQIGEKVQQTQQAQQPSQHPSAGLSLKKVSVEPGEPLRLEIESFLHAVRTRTKPLVSGEAGRAALSLALEINTAIAAHAKRAGL